MDTEAWSLSIRMLVVPFIEDHYTLYNVSFDEFDGIVA